MQDAYAELGLAEGSFPVSERMAEEVLSLPMGPHLSGEEVDYIVSKVCSFAG